MPINFQERNLLTARPPHTHTPLIMYICARSSLSFFFLTVTGGEHPHLNFIPWAFSRPKVLQQGTLYIYWVGWTYPARNLFYRSKSTKISNCTRTPLEPVRLVGLLLDRLQHQIGQIAWLDRSDRLRPILVVNSPDNTATDS